MGVIVTSNVPCFTLSSCQTLRLLITSYGSLTCLAEVPRCDGQLPRWAEAEVGRFAPILQSCLINSGLYGQHLKVIYYFHLCFIHSSSSFIYWRPFLPIYHSYSMVCVLILNICFISSIALVNRLSFYSCNSLNIIFSYNLFPISRKGMGHEVMTLWLIVCPFITQVLPCIQVPLLVMICVPLLPLELPLR